MNSSCKASDARARGARCRRGARWTCLFLSASLVTACRFAPLDFESWGVPDIGPETPIALRLHMGYVEERLFARHMTLDGLFLYRYPPVPDARAGSFTDLPDQACWSGYLLAALICAERCEPSAVRRGRIRQVLGSLRRLQAASGSSGSIVRQLVPEERFHAVARAPERWARCDEVPGYRARVDTSKDQWAGVVLGLAAAATLSLDSAVLLESRALLVDMARRLLADELRICGPDGEVTDFGDMRGRIWGVPIGVNATISLAYLSAGARFDPDPVWRERFVAASRPLVGALRPLHFEFLGLRNYNNDVMAAGACMALAWLEPEPFITFAVRGAVRESFVDAFQGEGNLLFACVARLYGLCDPVEERLALRNLASAPAVPGESSFDMDDVRGRARLLLRERGGNHRLREPIPLAVRPLSSFLWRSDPRVVRVRARPVEVSGVDLLAAYWIARYAGLVDVPQLFTRPQDG